MIPFALLLASPLTPACGVRLTLSDFPHRQAFEQAVQQTEQRFDECVITDSEGFGGLLSGNDRLPSVAWTLYEVALALSPAQFAAFAAAHQRGLLDDLQCGGSPKAAQALLDEFLPRLVTICRTRQAAAEEFFFAHELPDAPDELAAVLSRCMNWDAYARNIEGEVAHFLEIQLPGGPQVAVFQ